MKKKRSKPEIVELKDEEYDELVERVRNKQLSEQDWGLLLTLLSTLRFLQSVLRDKRMKLSKLKAMLFGPRTEKDKKPPKDDDPSGGGSTAANPAPVGADVAGTDATTTTGALGAESAGTATSEGTPEGTEVNKPKIPGHGRRGALSWEGASVKEHAHQTLCSGDPCPKCPTGRVYDYSTPSLLARVTGSSPLSVEVHKMQRLRCNACGMLFTAQAPKEVRDYPVATPEACATTAILKYEAATPFYRLARVLGNFGVPLPVARLWSMVEEVYAPAYNVFKELLDWIAQVPLFHADDTGTKILSLIKENEKLTPKKDRTGMQTTVIVGKTEDPKEQAVIYITGRQHAGENVAEVFARRFADLPIPIYIRDELPANSPKGVDTLEGGCNDHARRQFYSIRMEYPTTCGHVIEQYKIVYKADAEAKEKGLSPLERLAWHKDQSAPAMEEIQRFCQRQLDERLVEPNSALGGAIKYFLTHYPELTLFLREPGVPVSNAEAERAVKSQKLINKNSLFYKNARGALVGDVLLSFIMTCRRIGENAYDYFVALIRNRTKVEANPALWLPWNFRLQLAGSTS